MDSVIVSAPGKLMLLGEHAVVYDRSCLVTAVDQRMKLKIQPVNNNIFTLDAPDIKIINYKKPVADLGKGEIPKGARFVETAVCNFFEKYRYSEGIHVETCSGFSPSFGFGSSSASTVCTIKALSVLFDVKMSSKELFDLSYKTVLDIQGKGSGFDVAAAIYGKTLYFFTGGKVIEPLPIKTLPLIVGYSGIKADTVTIINQINEKAEKNPKGIERIFNQIVHVVELAKKALIDKDWLRLGIFMNTNQDYLNSLGVSTKKLDTMIQAARNAGAYGAKLSGAGGGDCMIAVAPENTIVAVRNAIRSCGGQIIDIVSNTEGVKIQ